MNGKFGITVIIPTFNSEKTIARALKSVLAQTSMPEEIIIIDDCSADLTAEILSSFLNCKQTKISFYRNQFNCGPGVSRNIGLKECKTEFVAFLDSDDTWLTNHLETAKNFFENNPHAVFISHSPLRSEVASGINEVYFHSLTFFRFLFLQANVSTIATVCRTDVCRHAGYFSAQRLGCEDFGLFLRIIKANPNQCYYLSSPRTASVWKPLYGSGTGLSGRTLPMFFGMLFETWQGLSSLERIFFAPLLFIWLSIKLLRRIAIAALKLH